MMVREALKKPNSDRSELDTHDLMQEIADAVGISAPTIRESLINVSKQRSQLLPKELLAKRQKLGLPTQY